MFASNFIRVVLLDDHPIFRYSMQIICDGSQDIKLVERFSSSKDLLLWLKGNDCDVLMLDYYLAAGEPDGLTLINEISTLFPDVKILLSSSLTSEAIIRTARAIGIKGYVDKRKEDVEYIEAVRVVSKGGYYFPEDDNERLYSLQEDTYKCVTLPGMMADKQSYMQNLLTVRERQVLECFYAGECMHNLAKLLNVSLKTVSAYKRSAMRKIGVLNDLELYKYKSDLFS